MPTYDYYCEKCQHKLEMFQKITDSPATKCPHCGADSLKRGPGGGVGLSFKGSGFYITDYKNSEEPKPSCCPCGKNKGCGS